MEWDKDMEVVEGSVVAVELRTVVEGVVERVVIVEGRGTKEVEIGGCLIGNEVGCESPVIWPRSPDGSASLLSRAWADREADFAALVCCSNRQLKSKHCVARGRDRC